MMAVGDVDQYHSGVAPSGIGYVSCDDRMMEPVAAVRRPSWRFTGCLVHAIEPEAPGLAGIGRVVHVDGHEDVIGKAVEKSGDVGPPAAGVPDAMDAAAIDRHESDPMRRIGFGNIEHRHSC